MVAISELPSTVDKFPLRAVMVGVVAQVAASLSLSIVRNYLVSQGFAKGCKFDHRSFILNILIGDITIH